MTSIPANLRDSSDPLALNWDFDNRMKSADTDNDSAADVFYEFDALGRRVARDDGTQDTIFVQVGQQTIADYVSGTAAASPETTYAWGSYIDELILRTEPNGTDLYYHRNQQYSTYAVTNSTGDIQERYAYSPYGELTITDASGTTRSASTNDTSYTYTGREWDADLGLYHFRARMYHARSGRFCSRDPIGYVEGMSQYRAYFVPGAMDPFGKRKVCCKYRDGYVIHSRFAKEIDCEDGKSAGECCKSYTNILRNWAVEDSYDGPCARRPNPTKTTAGATCACAAIIAIPSDPTDALGTPIGCGVAVVAGVTYLCCAEVVLEFPVSRSVSCAAGLAACLANPWQPDWNKDDFGRRKDCGACNRECMQNGGAWPTYKCPL
jgi:RHS repeat-associated protein